jgi:hypothetical protein
LLLNGRMAYREMTESRLSGYLASLPEIAARLGSRQALWQIRQVRASELSAVFVVEGPAGDLCVKQALPSTQEQRCQQAKHRSRKPHRRQPNSHRWQRNGPCRCT